MQELMKSGNTPMLFPYDPVEYWQNIRQIIREEVTKMEKGKPDPGSVLKTPGLTYKPLLKISELCTLFQVTKPTIYGWIKVGKIKPVKVRSRVYFLWQDVTQLMSTQTVSNE
ncbi:MULTISPECIES: helix-turn-helix domain-containing protein [Niastella]|uniref:Helix-turn-helix domain-containing protein n=1 Tax=Niastella soli TaxID=2821487 RepID=A0ABS3Z1T0_9BACT|nr:helix-turn-helix domain-containing protein [Niastella soli]MBO9203366.1 helix-turn-helix domain-containing protein [Niastella soli]